MTDQQQDVAEPKAGNGKNGPKAPLVAAPKNIGAIVPADIDQAWRLATIIASAGMAPKAYNKDPNAIMIGIMHGMEVGLTPMAALQSIAVINGMPTIWGDGALGLVRASGQLEDFNEFYEGEGESLTAVCVCKRRGEATPIRRTFSMDDAKDAGLKGKQGPWSQYPRRMLQMRARSWALRDGFADILRGLGMAEEVRDMGELVVDQTGTYRPGDARRPQRSDYSEAAADAQEAEIIDADRAAAGKPPIDQVDETEEPEPEAEAQAAEPEAEPVEPTERKDDLSYTKAVIAKIKAATSLDQVDRIMAAESGPMDSLPKTAVGSIEKAAATQREALLQ